MKSSLHLNIFISISLLLCLSNAEANLGVLDTSANGGINPATGELWQAGDIDQVFTVSSYGGSQDVAGTVEVRDGGLSLYMEGNRWQQVNFPYTITPNTVIEFDFQSTVEGEIQGLGFDNDLDISSNLSFTLNGSQTWGITDFATYSGTGVTHFTIPIGQYYTGTYQYLFFINDDDDNPTGNSLYSNIIIYEKEQPQLSVLDLSTNGGINPATGNYWNRGDISQTYPVASYGGGSQDIAGAVEIQDSGLSLFIEGNRWQQVNFPYTVTPNTIIEFDFQSTVETEISGIGFDNDLSISSNLSFQLSGTQDWGITSYATYTGNELTHFTIPIGEFYTGSYEYLFFINDDDNNPTGNGLYSNIVIYEGERPPLDCTTITNDSTLIFCDGFEEPDIDATPTQDLPSGWVATETAGLIDESSGFHNTLYGEQALWVDSGGLSTSAVNLSAVLTENVLYTLNFHVAKRTDQGGNYKVELLAGSTVLASQTGTPTESDFSESHQIEFLADSEHTSIGETLQIRLSTNGSSQPLFDNVSLTGVIDTRFTVAIEGVEDRYEVSSYGGTQDGSGPVEVRENGLSLFIEGNRWQKIDFPYSVTEDTIIEFDFQSTEEGEIQGLGFDNDLAISANRSFQISGTQNWGISDFATYSGNGVIHYTIPVGQFYTGEFDYLFFVNDDDNNPTGNSTFSNINVYENRNLIADFQMEEQSWNGVSGEVVDDTGNFNARAVNGPILESIDPAISGNPGTCRYGTFDGDNDYIELPSSFENLQDSFTITAWINPSNVQAGSRIFADDESNSHQGYALSLGDPGNGRLRFYSRGVSPISVDTSSSITPNTWTFVAAVHNSVNKTREIYVNGVAQTVTGGDISNTYTGTWGTAAGPASIGGETDSGETSNRFTGSIDEVKVFKSALNQTQIASIYNETHACSIPVVHHYEIEHDGQGLTCDAETITIKACMNSDCSILSTDEVSLDFQITNATTTSTEASVTFTGSIEVNLSHTVVEQLTMSVANASIDATNSVVCDSGSDTSCNISFLDTGFIFGNDSNSSPIIPTQLSGKPSNIGFNSVNTFIQAVRTDDSSAACVGLFPDGGEVPVNLSYTCHSDSSACTNNVILTNNSTSNSLTTTAAEHTLTFGADSKAYFSLNYPDAGKLRINVQQNIDVDGFGDIKVFDTSSNNFVVRPFGLELSFSEDSNGDNALAADTSGSAFKKAGEIFTLKATAKQWVANQDSDNNGVPDELVDLTGNNTAENFDNELVIVERELTLPEQTIPSTINEGQLTVEQSNSFNNSVVINEYRFSEVGIINLSASLSDGDYIGGGDIQGSISNVGRFTPAYFIQTVDSHGSLNANHSDDSACIINNWAYSGQETNNNGAISYDMLSAPKVLITAYNENGVVTQNYTEAGFMKLASSDIAIVEPTEDYEKDRISPDFVGEKVNITSDMHTGALAVSEAGILDYEFNLADHFKYEHTEHSLYAPFPAKIPFTISQVEDTDGISLYSGPDNNISPTEQVITEGVEIRFGRWRLENNFGPETENLLLPMYIEEFDGTSFELNNDEQCIVGMIGTKVTGSTALALWDYRLEDLDTSDSLLTSDTSASITSNKTFEEGTYRELIFSAPLNNKQGSLKVEYEVAPWLKYDWDNDGEHDNNPEANLTFGVFRGNDRIIYIREVFN